MRFCRSTSADRLRLGFRGDVLQRGGVLIIVICIIDGLSCHARYPCDETCNAFIKLQESIRYTWRSGTTGQALVWRNLEPTETHPGQPGIRLSRPGMAWCVCSANIPANLRRVCCGTFYYCSSCDCVLKPRTPDYAQSQ